MSIEYHAMPHFHLAHHNIQSLQLTIVMMYFFDLQTDPPPDLIHQLLGVIRLCIVITLKFCNFFLFGLSEPKTNQVISPQQEEIHCLYPLNNRR